VLIIVQNLPVPLDRRVWLECQALRAAGYEVSVICPKGPGDPSYHEVDGVHLYKYQAPPEARGALGFAVEFTYCLIRVLLLSLKVRRRHGFDVLQACNPPDTYWVVAALYRPFGVRFVYDQHDLNPEVFVSRFGSPKGVVQKLQYRMLLWLERMTYRCAHHVISTNESYRHVALTRGLKSTDDVTVVRSGPDTSRMRPVVPLPELRGGREHLICYLGIMGPQDGVDVALRALSVLVHDMGRRDIRLALLGFGDCFDELRQLAHELLLHDYVTFTGRADAKMISEYLSSSEVGVSPDPLNPLNDVSTMNKTMEYMAYALPVVAFDLKETRVSAESAAVYVEPGDVEGFAKAIAELIDDPERRAKMAEVARARAAAVLDWEPQRRAYVGTFDRVCGVDRPRASDPTWPEVDRRSDDGNGPLVDTWGNELVDLRRPRDVRRYLRPQPGAPDVEQNVPIDERED
jgi:glycosyltransferase involved in cell wall biosynthesis